MKDIEAKKAKIAEKIPPPVQKPQDPAPQRAPPTAPPAGVKQTDIDNVENDTLLRSVAYCEARAAEIAAIFQKNIQAGVRVDPALRAINNACHKTKSMIEQGCQGGHITPQEYAAMLAELLQKDLALIKYFGSDPAN